MLIITVIFSDLDYKPLERLSKDNFMNKHKNNLCSYDYNYRLQISKNLLALTS